MSLEEIKRELNNLANATMNLQHLINWNQNQYEQMQKEYKAYLSEVNKFLENFYEYNEQEKQRQLGVIVHLYEQYRESEE